MSARLEAGRPPALDSDGVRDLDEFVVHVHGNAISARWPSSGYYSSPPAFHGTFAQDRQVLIVEGRIRESFGDSLWAALFGGVTVVAVLLAIFGVITLITGTGTGGLAPLLIGVIAASLCAVLWRALRAARRPSFAANADRLEAGLVAYLWAGRTDRPAA